MNETTGMEQAMLAQDSWVLALEGIFALIIGFLILFWPAMSLVTLTLFVGAFALVSGIFTLVGALKAKKRESRVGNPSRRGWYHIWVHHLCMADSHYRNATLVCHGMVSS
ncbi:putative membrane protein HdeD, DUF308 family [Candidatus Methanophagaceae archaeon]|nr:putative membrane protein HdeD, DUF308 family [Methanophagales archaeon]